MSAWSFQPTIAPGSYIRGNVVSGLAIEFPAVTVAEYSARLREYAQGWELIGVDYKRTLFGIDSHFLIYGRATMPLSADDISSQMSAALNSFWSVMGVSVVVEASNTLDRAAPASSPWSNTLRIIAFAAIAVAVAVVYREYRKG